RRRGGRTYADAQRAHHVGLMLVGQHRHLVPALRALVDHGERARLVFLGGAQAHLAVAGDAKELHGTSSRRANNVRAVSASAAATGPAAGISVIARPSSESAASCGSKGTRPRQGRDSSAASLLAGNSGRTVPQPAQA